MRACIASGDTSCWPEPEEFMVGGWGREEPSGGEKEMRRQKDRSSPAGDAEEKKETETDESQRLSSYIVVAGRGVRRSSIKSTNLEIWVVVVVVVVEWRGRKGEELVSCG